MTAAGEGAARDALIACCRALNARGLTHAKSGNVSLRRDAETFFISPTGIPYEQLRPDDVVLMDYDGRWFGEVRPSSEWRFHRDLLRARSEINAVVHTHSRYATALACTGCGIPAFHYMVAIAGGADIRCAAYATFGSQALSDRALAALEGRSACLLANHGMIALGGDLDQALALAGEVENLAAQYAAALALGDVKVLDSKEMALIVEKFRAYGAKDGSDDALQYGGPNFI